jgi:DNA mismatch endonuclease, patch repair protein
LVDNFTRQKRSEIMAKVRSQGNASTEIKALQILKRGAITGWRRHLPMFGHPDFAFPKARVALFIDGCFWHGCPRC